MSTQIQANVAIATPQAVSRAFRPTTNPEHCRVNKRDGRIQYRHPNGMWVNSALRKDEWEELDEAVVAATGPRTARLDTLTRVPLGGIGTLVSQWNVASQMTAAQISISGRAQGQGDRVDYKLAGVAVPVVWKEFDIGERELDASRRMGNGLDTTTAFEAGRVVSEKLIDMYYNGDADIDLNGNNIYGLTTHPQRNTGSAAGDFGTITNIRTTILNMITAANADNFYGPYDVDVANTQYIEMLARYTDGSGQTALATVLELPQISNVYPSDQLTAGSLVLAQSTRDVQDYAVAMDVMLVEWMSGDGMTHHFKVMAIQVPRIKSEYSDKSGVVHYTGA